MDSINDSSQYPAQAKAAQKPPGPTCASCGTSISAGSEIVFEGKNKQASRTTVCSNCAYDIERALQAETEAPNLIGALLVGLGAAFLSTLLWYVVVIVTKYQLGIVAVAVGWLVAQGAIYGAGKKRGLYLQILSVAITVVAMGAGQYFTVRHFAVEALKEQGYTGVPLFLSMSEMIEVVIESLKDDPLTLLFWGIAVWQAFALPAPRRLRRAIV